MESIYLELTWPGQVTHESRYTGSVQVISRGIGRWTGTISFPQIGRAEGAADIRVLDAFFANAEGAVHQFDVPWELVEQRQIDSIPLGNDLRLLSTIRVDNTMSAVINHASGLLAGDRITIDSRMFVLVTNLVGGSCVLSPWRPLEIPTDGLPVNWTTPTCRMRLVESNPVSVTRNIDWVGPWAASVVDVL